ncbi:PP2C family serine/threonine-protein phosphatase [Pectobacterium polaris]|uniref:PP2C family serine/threonine-protein phosphatase n=1 Tax=Pectobacterium polaris TaxID=2042057 RepID=UPI00202D3E9E|nr:PP2C family serine/threonine-protein phosphatase [Pectobacterium polaris]MCL6324424.1 protein phosphatase 2C domain-containing protein [Pectobacterium polaris]
MDHDVSLNRQIFMLILQQAGKTLPEAEHHVWDDDTELCLQLEKLREQVMLKVEGTPPTSAATLPDVVTASGLDDTLPFEIIVSESVEPASASGAESTEQENAEKAQWETMPFAELNATKNNLSGADMLKPGQIPTSNQRQNAAPTARAPQAKVNIANARVGTPFNAPIEIILDNGIQPDIQDVIFGEAIGLHFDRDTTSLVGTPTQSGDREITLHWSCGAALTGTTTVLLIVNPDPRSLWKIIDPPADDRYFKANVAHQLIRQPDVNIAAASRRGRSHEHVGTFRDDDYFIAHDNDSGWSVLLVADGAGSAKNSREGSRLVTTVVGTYLAQQMAEESAARLKPAIALWTPEGQKEVGTFFGSLFYKVAQLAVNKLDAVSIETGEHVKSYSTTLLATVSLRTVDGLFAASFWLGDGAIAAYGPVGKVRLLGKPDSGEYAGQTRFLDLNAVQDPQFSERVIIGKWSDISHLILMTDGVSDPYFETDNGLKNPEKWDVLVADIAPCLNDSEQAAEQLAEWLNFFSPGNHDDRTIVVAW